jgi:beta-phosphoglucomutase-like phosphatase (HAD superfamily)
VRIFSAGEVEQGKPEPDLFRYAAEQIGVTPGRNLVVENSGYCVAGAKAAVMKAIGFAGGIMRAADVEQADAVNTDMADLPGAVKRLLCLSLSIRGAASS